MTHEQLLRKLDVLHEAAVEADEDFTFLFDGIPPGDSRDTLGAYLSELREGLDSLTLDLRTETVVAA